jgi:hypothetical protein
MTLSPEQISPLVRPRTLDFELLQAARLDNRDRLLEQLKRGLSKHPAE